MTTAASNLVVLEGIETCGFRARTADGQPMLVAGAMAEWPAMGLWDHAYLREAKTRDDSPLPVFHAPSRDQPMRPLDGTMALAEIVDRLWGAVPCAPYAEGSLFYLKQRPIQHFPGLLRDVRRPMFYPDNLVEVNLWIGGAGCSSPLHFDYVDNLVAQVRGRRRVRLYSPDQGRWLYPAYALCPPTDELRPPHFSLVGDPGAADARRFPRFAHIAPVVDIVLGPGDMLYIPPYWWHHVEIVEGPAVQVNFWYSLQFGGAFTGDEHKAEMHLMESLRALLDRASPSRRAGLGAVVKSLCDASGEPPA